jgi:hypothetical protein
MADGPDPSAAPPPPPTATPATAAPPPNAAQPQPQQPQQPQPAQPQQPQPAEPQPAPHPTDPTTAAPAGPAPAAAPAPQGELPAQPAAADAGSPPPAPAAVQPSPNPPAGVVPPGASVPGGTQQGPTEPPVAPREAHLRHADADARPDPEHEAHPQPGGHGRADGHHAPAAAVDAPHPVSEPGPAPTVRPPAARETERDAPDPRHHAHREPHHAEEVTVIADPQDLATTAALLREGAASLEETARRIGAGIHPDTLPPDVARTTAQLAGHAVSEVLELAAALTEAALELDARRSALHAAVADSVADHSTALPPDRSTPTDAAEAAPLLAVPAPLNPRRLA